MQLEESPLCRTSVIERLADTCVNHSDELLRMYVNSRIGSGRLLLHVCEDGCVLQLENSLLARLERYTDI